MRYFAYRGLPWWLSGEESSALQETRVQALGWKDPLEKEMTTQSSILAWRFHGQGILVGYSPWGCKESDMTERLSLSLYKHVSKSVRSIHYFLHFIQMLSSSIMNK